jgi:hypothetical protein
MKYAILMAHGVDPPSRVRIVGETSRADGINAMSRVQKNSTGQPWDKPGHGATRRDILSAYGKTAGSCGWGSACFVSAAKPF